MTETISPQTAINDPMEQSPASYVEWEPILAGTAIASAITIVLTGFGSAIGLSLVSPFKGSGVSGTALAVATGLWVIWVGLSSLIAGCYLTGRLRKTAQDAKPEEVHLRDGAHGLVVWSLSILIGAILAVGGIAAVGRAGGETVKSGVLVASNLANGATDYAVDGLSRSQGTGVPLDPDARAQIGRILVRTGTDGQLSPQDRVYLTRTLAISAGVTPAEAERRIVGMLDQANRAIESAKMAVEQARRSSILIAFLTAASLAVAAAASWWAASLGGKHRDENTDIAHIFRW